MNSLANKGEKKEDHEGGGALHCQDENNEPLLLDQQPSVVAKQVSLWRMVRCDVKKYNLSLMS